MERMLRVGDMVWWSDFFGVKPWRPATVKKISVTKGEGQWKDGEGIPWDEVRRHRVVVDLTNGYWALGNQIAPYGSKIE